MSMKTGLLAIAVLAIGCGKDPMGGGGGDDAPADAPTTPADAFVPPEGFTKLVTGNWSLQPGATDIYKCVHATVTTDTYITNFIAQAPEGTHHTVLTIADNQQAPDGQYDCSVGDLGMVMLYASGVGTSPLDFPNGTGVKIPAGTKIHLNLHLYNASDDPISGESGIHIKTTPTAPPMLAEMVFAGTTEVIVPPNPQSDPEKRTPITGECQATKNFSLFAVWPHMHQIAVHQKLELVHNTQTTVVHDKPFDFREQNYYLQAPIIEVAQGDTLRVTCTYKNNTGQYVTIGDGSNQEMCFTGLYRYPASNAGIFECTEGPGI